MKNKLINFCRVAVGLLIISSPVFAHHGAAAYDTTKSTTVKGKVVEFLFINPHCQLYIEATDEKGNAVKWVGEFTNPSTLHRRGWTKEMFKAGDPITLIGDRAKNGATIIRVLKVGLSDGRTLAALGADDN
jgi:hypothetical protein